MLPPSEPDRIRIAFDDHRLVSNAGLILPVTLAQCLGLRELVGNHVDLGNAPGRANKGDKMMTLVASALAGGILAVILSSRRCSLFSCSRRAINVSPPPATGPSRSFPGQLILLRWGLLLRNSEGPLRLSEATLLLSTAACRLEATALNAYTPVPIACGCG